MGFEVKLQEIVERYDLNLVVSFGSYNTERFTQKSDIDLGYLSARNLNTTDQLGLIRDFVVLFQRDRIDLVDLSKAPPLLLYEVAVNGQVLYEQEDNYLLFKLKASARYADTKPLREKRKKYLDDLVRKMKG